MSGAQLYYFVLLGCTLILASILFGDAGVAQSQSKVVFQIQSDDAIPDSTLPERIRTVFGNRITARLDYVALDLNDDGKKEKFATNKSRGGNGPYPWLVFDAQMKRVIADFEAHVVYVLSDRQKGYNILECYCRVRGDLATVTDYAFNGRKYQKTRSLELHDQEVNRFIENRKGISHPEGLPPGD